MALETLRKECLQFKVSDMISILRGNKKKNSLNALVLFFLEYLFYYGDENLNTNEKTEAKQFKNHVLSLIENMSKYI